MFLADLVDVKILEVAALPANFFFEKAIELAVAISFAFLDVNLLIIK